MGSQDATDWPPAGANGAVGKQIQLPLPDAVLHVATGTVFLFIKALSIDFVRHQKGHHIAWVGTARLMFDFADHPPRPTPPPHLLRQLSLGR